MYEYLSDFEDGMIKTTKLADIGIATIAIPISPERAEYFDFLNKLANDIIENPQKAKEFVSNPNSYIRTRGFSYEVTLDEELENITKALADDEINTAIKNNDIKKYLLLLHKKRIFKYNV